ncbi:Ubiquinone/menaquinone biosynthesis C-methyltransferase UbiE [Planctomycetes bacterium Pan216]|uniref:Ubiquinone/menaquinone biosynthesis C-methyltransferase UbiE n=1 Tax=Kolteria novifilia TaxID=2527975 RepID=A0A518AZE8_9BACT|nr:Ubiquinone/menaquinone biosynthesis C-methyltransferase UbiE [Planctomycetes bacterium Pan216]
MRTFLWFLLAATVLVSPIIAQETAAPVTRQSVKPGINKPFLDPKLEVEEWIERFEVESREIVQAKDEILKELNLSPGQRIGDIGAGTGLFVAPFSRAVGEKGWVYAVDIVPRFVERYGKIIDILHLQNVTPVLCGQDDVRLPPGSIDVAFVCDVYHHFEYPDQSLASIHEALVPGGKLVVIDFERIPGKSREWLLGHVRAGKEVFREEVEKAGFHFVKEASIPTFEENYYLVFER